MPASAEITARLRSFRQEHVLQWWDELDEPSRQRLVEQIAAIDFEEIEGLWKTAAGDAPAAFESDNAEDRAARARPPADLVRLDSRAADPSSWIAASEAGDALLRQGRVGVILVAGGEGTRLQFPHPKGMFPVGPVTQRSLFQYLAEQLAVRSQRSGARIPFYIMTSDATHAKSVAFFREHRWFGLREDDVRFFRQGTMPVVSLADGRLLMASRGEIAVGPDGHGGLVSALSRAGLIDDMRQRGVEQLFYLQVDNAAVKVCDPEFLGFHMLHGAELSTKVVAKRTAGEKMGVLCDVDGRTEIIEYSDMPPAVANLKDESGGLIHWAGNTAIHVISRSLLDRLVGGEAALPFHIARKHVKYIDSTGRLVEPKPPGDQPNACKFEKFIFDALPIARRTLVVEADRFREFIPLKDLKGENSPEAVKAGLNRLFSGWLAQRGIAVPEGTPVEISPLAAIEDCDLDALDAAALEARIERRLEGWVLDR